MVAEEAPLLAAADFGFTNAADRLPWLANLIQVLVKDAVLRAGAVGRQVTGVKAAGAIADGGAVESRVVSALHEHLGQDTFRDRRAVVELLNGMAKRATRAERAEPGHVEGAGLPLHVSQLAARPHRTKPATIRGALRHLVLRPGMREGALRVRTLTDALKEGARRDKAINVLVQVQAVLAVHARTT